MIVGAEEAPKPLRRDAQRNRERIMAAARELFAERGVEATLDGVAGRAGVGVGTVYRRYPNKDALLDELFEERVGELAALAEASVSDADPWGALIRFLERVEELFVADRALEHLVLHPDESRRHLTLARERLQAPIETLVERAKAGGRLRADFEPADIRMIHRMLAAVVQDTNTVSPDLWRRYFVMLVDGLATSRSAPTDTGVAPPALPDLP
jgi:AcrR family transcriptional regulator